MGTKSGTGGRNTGHLRACLPCPSLNDRILCQLAHPFSGGRWPDQAMGFLMKRRILIVDDDRDHAESIVDLVAMRGHEVEIAGSGEAGIAHFRAAEFFRSSC